MKAYFNHLIILLLIAMLAFFVSGCGPKEINGAWTANDITADGLAADWHGIPLSYYEDREIGLGLSNDSTNLYVLFRFENPRWAVHIRMTGINFWIDQDGGKDKIFGLYYNGGPEGELLDSARNRFREMASRRGIKRTPEPRPVQFMVLDNKAEQRVKISEGGDDGPSVGYSYVDGYHTYELAIPLELISDEFYGVKMAPGNEIGIGIEWALRPGRGEGFEGGAPGDGMRGGMGGRMGGRMMGRRAGMDLPEEQEFWISAKLAESESMQSSR